MRLRPHALIAALSLTVGSLTIVAAAPPANATTNVSGELSSDTTWTAANSPYVLTGDVVVPAGTTLTIEPGVEVQRPNEYPGRSILVAGSLTADGTAGQPITWQQDYGVAYQRPFISPTDAATGAVDLDDVSAQVSSFVGDFDGNSAFPAEFASFSLTNSNLQQSTVRVDGTQGDVAITGNLLVSTEVSLKDPQRALSTIADNRFRAGGITCAGAGRLDVHGNTFERGVYPYQGSRLRSQDDCVIDASNNFWEATDNSVRASRLEGEGRIVTSPLAASPSVGTPQSSSGDHQQDRSTDPYGRQVLNVRTSSDGGSPATIIAKAVNRESGEVEETHEVAVPTNLDGERLVPIRFDDLVEGRLYRLTSFVKNGLGETTTLETESFLAPARTEPPAPDTTPFGPVTITQDTTWTKAMSPIGLTGNIRIAEGATLRVEPGVEVRRKGWSFILDGKLDLAGTRDEPVVFPQSQCCNDTLVTVGNAAAHATLTIAHTELFNNDYSGASWLEVPADATLDLAISDSLLRGGRLQIDGRRTTGSVTRNRFIGTYSSEITVANPVADGLTISDNRLRGMRLGCSGVGTLVASANTFETSTRVRSADDCRLDVSGNYWEAPDSTIGNRVEGAGRVAVLPTAVAASATTPVLPPADISIYRPSNRDLYVLSVTAGSDGGSPATITVYATDRDSGDVVESHEIDLASAQADAATVVFSRLAPGGLYRLSAYAENAAGRTPVVETESFVVPADESSPNPDGGIFVSGTLTQDTTWTLEDSPVTVTGPLVVPAGRTLTVAPGVRVQAPDECCVNATFRVAGTVAMMGSEAEPVVLQPDGFFRSNEFIFSSAAGQPGGTVRLDHVTMRATRFGNLWNPFGGSNGVPNLVEISDSTISGLRLDTGSATAPSLAVVRSTLVGVSLRTKVADDVTVHDSRFRGSGLECTGAGRLNATGNTFERGSTGLSSQDDCILDVTGSHWEAPDNEVPGRISGAARALVRPTASTPTADTPRLAPAQPQVYYYLDNAGRAVANVRTASDGGAPASVTVSLVDRESGEVVDSYEATSTSPGQELTYEFDGLTPGGLYRIAAVSRNAVGESEQASTESFLAPIPAPGTPTDVRATAGASSVTVTWQAPALGEGRPVTRYTVEGSPGSLSKDVSGDTLSTTFSGLAPGTYSFIVRATNEYGDSDWSAPVEVTVAAPGGGGGSGGGGGGGAGGGGTTAPSTAPKAPSNVTAVRGDGKATVSWTAPATDPSITGYLVYVSPSDRVITVEGSSTSATVLGLTNGESYSFSVEAVNAKGASERSATSPPVVPAGLPFAAGAPDAQPRDGSLLVSWPAHKANGSPITEYVVEVNPGNTRVTVAGTETQALVTGLTNGSTYSVTVTSKNEVGRSDSASTTPAIPGAPPAAPAEVTAKGSDGRIIVTWDGADEKGYRVTGYRVTVSPGNTVLEVAPDARRAVISGLDNGGSYTVTVRALSDLGPGEPATIDDVVPVGAPLKVDEPTVTPKKRGIKVVWQAPDDQGSPITGYLVSVNGDEIEVDARDTRLLVRGLEPGRYRFRVVAINAIGASKPGAWTDRVAWPSA